MPPKPTLSYVAEEVRRYDRDRFVAGLFAAPERREALFALYAFNLEVAKVPELVHEPFMGRIRLQWWRDRLAGAGSEPVPEHPVAGVLLPELAAIPAARAHLDVLLDAREADLEHEPPADLAALEAYAEATGGRLMRVAAMLLGADGAAADAAAAVGTGWALTGLLRAVPFHAAQGRLYLPLDLLADAGLAAQAVLAGPPSPRLAGVAESIAKRAAGHLERARGLRRKVDRRALPALLPAVLAERYLARLARHGHQPFAAGWADPRPGPARLALAWALGRY